MILKTFSSGPAETNTYFLACPKTRLALVIDNPLDSTPWILEQKGEFSIQMILLTHSHWDHIADSARLMETLRVPLYVHKEDAANLEHPGADGLPCPFFIPPTTPTGNLTDGQIITVGELSIEVIHTPGHSPGCVCFYLAQEKTLFSGDTLFRGGMGNVSFPTSSPKQMKTSLQRLAALPPDTRVYPGHAGPTQIDRETRLIHRYMESL